MKWNRAKISRMEMPEENTVYQNADKLPVRNKTARHTMPRLSSAAASNNRILII
jgi:hypothetical protein